MKVSGNCGGLTIAVLTALFFVSAVLSGCGNAGNPGGGGETPDVTPPTVQILTPSGGCTVSGVVDITIDASDDTGVAVVELYLDEELLTNFTDPPYLYTWDTSAQNEESLCSLRAVAYDAAGNSAETDGISIRIDNEQTWNRVGDPEFTRNFGGEGDITAEQIRFYVDPSSETPYVGIITAESHHPLVEEWSGAVFTFAGGSGWELVGGGSFASSIGKNLCDLYVLEGTPYVAYADTENDNRLCVKRFNGTAWEALSGGDPLPSDCRLVSLHVRDGGGIQVPWIFVGTVGSRVNSRVYTYENGDWRLVGHDSREADAADLLFSVGGHDAEPLLLWQNGADPVTLSAIESKGWVPVNGGEISGTDPAACVFEGTIYTLYSDNSTGVPKRYVAEWDGSGWQHIGCSPGGDPILDTECLTGQGTAGISVCGGTVFAFLEETGTAGGTTRFLQYNSGWQELEKLNESEKMERMNGFEVVNGNPYRAYVSPDGFVSVETWS